MYQSLFQILQDVFDQLEDYFVESVLNLVSSRTSPSDGSVGYSTKSATGISKKKSMPQSRPWDLYGLEFFKERAKRRHHIQIDLLISRGLPFIKRLLCLRLQDRQTLIFSYYPDLRPGLRAVLEAGFFFWEASSRTKEMTAGLV